MNTTILNPKAQLLLDAGLDVLHFESQEWLETLAFWKDEATFFDHLLKKKVAKEANMKDYVNMLKDLDKIHKNLFNDFEEVIMTHERMLSKIQQGEKGISDSEYRKKHYHIKLRMNTFTKDFKTFKKIVFDYAKDL